MGKRDRREFADSLVAPKEAIHLQELWMKEEARHWRLLAQDQQVFPDDPRYLPVWTGMPLVEAQAHQEYLSSPPEDVGDDENDDALPPDAGFTAG